MTAIQRFGSALNTNPHFHSLVLDGVYGGPPHAPGPFLPLPPPELEDVTRVMAGTGRRVMRLLQKRGLENEEDPLAEDDPLLATLMAASVRSQIATGKETGQPWRRLGDRVEPMEPPEDGVDQKAEPPPRCVREGGLSLHADVSLPAHDRKRLERLARYVLRPPLSLDRLESLPDGRLAYRLKTPWRDGTTHILMERSELLERVAPLIPPPRAHQVRLHGILAPCASGRDLVVPGGRRAASTASAGGDGNPEAACAMDRARTCLPLGAETGPVPTTTAPNESRTVGTQCGSPAPQGAQPTQVPHLAQPAVPHPAPFTRPRRLPWADLLQRIFGVEALRCPCGESMRVIAVITDPAIAKRILECMGLPQRAPPLTPPSTPDLAIDPWLTESTVADFDQTPPSDWDPGA